MFFRKHQGRWGHEGVDSAAYIWHFWQSTATALVRWPPCCLGLSQSLKILPDSMGQRYIKYSIFRVVLYYLFTVIPIHLCHFIPFSRIHRYLRQ